jgi:phage terminase small subunit
MRKDTLTPLKRRFCDQYLVDLDAPRAVVAAGYKVKHPKDAATRLLHDPGVQAYIATRERRLSERLGVSAERVVSEYARIAFADLRSVATWGPDGAVVNDSAALSSDDAAAVAEVTNSPATGIKVKMHDKLAALAALAKHLGLFVDRSEVDVKLSLAALIAASQVSDDK